MSKIVYRFITEAPIDEIINLYKEAGWWKEGRYSPSVIPKMIAGSFCFLGVFHEDRLIGMGRVISDGVSDGYIQDVVVRREFRKRGLGAIIIRHLVEFCQKNGLEWFGLVAEPGTSHFYQKLGFRLQPDHTLMVYEGDLKGG